ncbi:MAG: peptidoglycan DD-metalloendopeptidase family protein [Candidatus Liptonbacteria bacterium]
MRMVRVLVLPVPAPATINKGRSGAVAAAFWFGFRLVILLVEVEAALCYHEYISTTLSHLYSNRKPFIVAVFLVTGLICLNFIGHKQSDGQNDHIMGGPVVAEARINTGITPVLTDTLGAVLGGGAVDNTGTSPESLEKYGDSVSSLGAVQDIRAFPGSKEAMFTGIIIYEVRKGDTLQGIALAYKTTVSDIKQLNTSLKNTLKAGASLSIPTVLAANTPSAQAAGSVQVALATADITPIAPYFAVPAAGFNWGILHSHNGIDIANICGTPIVAAADGLVVPDSTCIPDDNWDGGYGTCLTLEHPNGTRTRYAHLSKVSVEIGDYVKQGETIGLMGKTGEATGCHLHFEVQGATNPFARS